MECASTTSTESVGDGPVFGSASSPEGDDGIGAVSAATPTVYTCSRSLILQTSYKSFSEFKEEFDSILQSSNVDAFHGSCCSKHVLVCKLVLCD